MRFIKEQIMTQVWVYTSDRTYELVRDPFWLNAWDQVRKRVERQGCDNVKNTIKDNMQNSTGTTNETSKKTN